MSTGRPAPARRGRQAAGHARRAAGARHGRAAGRARRAAGALALAAAAAAAGCGSVTGRPATAEPAGPPALSLTTGAEAAGATWAAIPMGAASGADEFWQLFALPAGGQHWSLQTPPDIATNGAIVLAAPGAAAGTSRAGTAPEMPASGEAAGKASGTGTSGGTLVAGIRPSLDLGFSPITSTADQGRQWTASPPQPGLANVPDALAVAPGGQLIALGLDGAVTASAGTGAAWSTLTTERTLATGPARDCGLTALTAAAYTPAGTPLLAGTCTRPGAVAVLGYTGGTWHQAGPALPAPVSGQRIRVLRLTRTSDGDVALLEAGSAPSLHLLAAWTGDGGRHWVLSPVLETTAAAVSASYGNGGLGVMLAGHQAVTLAGPAASWRRLPALPGGQPVTLALPAGGDTDALAAHGGTLTVWRLAPGGSSWVRAQTVTVPIQYGSSS